MLDGVMEHVMDGVCDGVCNRVCDKVWLFGKDSFKECPLTNTMEKNKNGQTEIQWKGKNGLLYEALLYINQLIHNCIL